MQILRTGVDFPSGQVLGTPIDEREFARRIGDGVSVNAQLLNSYRRQWPRDLAFRREMAAKPSVDLTDPLQAGWSFVVNRDDPNRDAVISILEPLARARGMRDPQLPLMVDSSTDWARWMIEVYGALDRSRRPHYVMLAGGPALLPFRFQSLLGLAAAVGRIDFESLTDLSTYVDKVLRLEQAREPSSAAKALFFAPDSGKRPDGSYDATHFSRRFLVEPLAAHVATTTALGVEELKGPAATKQALLERMRELQPALLYTASHGVGALTQPVEVQQRINGAICCQRSPQNKTMDDYLFSAADVPASEPFLEGGLIFQFACFGYGTPAVSDFATWNLGVPERNAPFDFVAALPKRLLAHPRGPVAFIGHVDTSWVHGFGDQEALEADDRWHPRLVPFRSALDVILNVQPTGLALADLRTRCDVMNSRLADVLEAKARGEYEDTQADRKRLATDFIVRGDAQNYFTFGDPAVKVRVGFD